MVDHVEGQFRDLGLKGGPFYDEHAENPAQNRYVRAIAAEFQIADIDTETGETLTFATVKPGREGLTVRLAPEAKAWAEAAVVGGYADLADAFAGFLAAHPMELEA